MHPARYLATRATFAPPTDTGGSGIAPDGGDQAEETLTADATAFIAAVEQLLAALPGIIAAAVATALANTPTGVADAAALAADTAVKAEIAKVQAALPAPPPPPPPPPSLTFSPASVSAVAGVASQTAVAISGGTVPYALFNPPGGVTYDGANVNFDATTVAGSGNLEFEDSSATPISGELAYSITAAPAP